MTNRVFVQMRLSPERIGVEMAVTISSAALPCVDASVCIAINWRPRCRDDVRSFPRQGG
jgi:hypothetical protein